MFHVVAAGLELVGGGQVGAAGDQSRAGGDVPVPVQGRLGVLSRWRMWSSSEPSYQMVSAWLTEALAMTSWLLRRRGM